jgi:hypothetical protein
LAQEASVVEIRVVLGFSLGLELAELFEVLLEGSMDALFV